MFRKILRFALAAGILLLASTGFAAVKITPALQKATSDQFVCRVLNTGPTELTGIALRILNSSGSLLTESTVLTPGPGATGSLAYSGTATVAYCKLEGSFSRKRTLLTFCVVRSGETICETAVGDPGL